MVTAENASVTIPCVAGTRRRIGRHGSPLQGIASRAPTGGGIRANGPSPRAGIGPLETSRRVETDGHLAPSRGEGTAGGAPDGSHKNAATGVGFSAAIGAGPSGRLLAAGPTLTGCIGGGDGTDPICFRLAVCMDVGVAVAPASAPTRAPGAVARPGCTASISASRRSAPIV